MTEAKSPGRPFASSAGFSLVELMAAMLITVVAIMGLAHTFGLGTSFIDRYATARAALARATGQLEHVRGQVKSGAAMATTDSVSSIQLAPQQSGQMRTVITEVNDPADGTADAVDYYRVVASVQWMQGGITDSVRVQTVMLRP